ncbi:MAG: hypothetical protein IT324_28005 [Anaerolineae bacterium]|nr:hypothetical protein [Anaerolineae bacterium]
MFAPSDFKAPTPPRPPLQHNRLIGALVLLVCIVLCLALVLSADRAIFIPYNATHAITQTWQADHPATPTRPRQIVTRTPQARRTPTPDYNQQARGLDPHS